MQFFATFNDLPAKRLNAKRLNPFNDLPAKRLNAKRLNPFNDLPAKRLNAKRLNPQSLSAKRLNAKRLNPHPSCDHCHHHFLQSCLSLHKYSNYANDKNDHTGFQG
jgi:hypothetical protein